MTTSPTSCYSLSGLLSPYDAYTYIPCNLTAIENGQHSACCAPGDKCLSNGLCQYGGNMNGANEFWRVGCTDSTYKDPACPKYCANVEPDLEPNHLVFQCPGKNKWCCGTGHLTDYPERGTLNTTCCDIADLEFEAEGAVVWTTALKATIDLSISTSMASQPTGDFPSSAVVFPSSLTSIPSVTGTNAAETVVVTSTQAAAAQGNSANALALGLGFGLGIPVGIMAIVSFVFLLLRQRRRDKEKAAAARYGPESQEDLRTTHPHAFYREAGGRELAVELATKPDPVEVWSPMSPVGPDKEMYR